MYLHPTSLDIIHTANTYDYLLELCTRPSVRILFYTEIHKYLIKTLRIVITDNQDICRFQSCYSIIDTIMYVYSPLWANMPEHDRIKIYKQFHELRRRRPFHHWLICKLYPYQDKYTYWGSTFDSHITRLIIINECISECLKAMLWTQQQKQ